MDSHDITNAFYLRNMTRFSTIIPNCYPPRWFECDLMAITHASFFYEFEIKVSVSDFLADAKKGYGPTGPSKHELMAQGDIRGPSKFWFVIPASLAIDMATVPPFAGLLHAHQDGARIHFKEVKRAQRLHKVKMSEQYKDVVRKNLYFRYWSERLAHISSPSVAEPWPDCPKCGQPIHPNIPCEEAMALRTTAPEEGMKRCASCGKVGPWELDDLTKQLPLCPKCRRDEAGFWRDFCHHAETGD